MTCEVCQIKNPKIFQFLVQTPRSNINVVVHLPKEECQNHLRGALWKKTAYCVIVQCCTTDIRGPTTHNLHLCLCGRL